MKVDVVVDVGNTRIKWGRCGSDRVLHMAPVSSAVDDWVAKIRDWCLREPASWAISSVQPQRSDALIQWLRNRGNSVWVLDDHRQLPLDVHVEHPEQVGLDRLLNAVAAKLPPRGRLPAVVVDAG